MLRFTALILGVLLLGVSLWLSYTRQQPRQAWIAFYVECPDALGTANIYRIHPDGSGLHRLTNLAGFANAPVWSIDGRWVYFHADDGGQLTLYRMQPDGTGLESLMSVAEFLYPNGSIRRLGRYWVREETTPQGMPLFYLTDQNGRHIQPLFSGEYLVGRAWSADEKQIAYSFVSDGYSAIWLMDSDGRNRRQLTFNTGGSWNPSWSPDEGWIVFNSWEEEHNRHQLYKIRPDGSDLTRLIELPCSMAQPAWSPQGEVAWQSQGLNLLGLGSVVLGLLGYGWNLRRGYLS